MPLLVAPFVALSMGMLIGLRGAGSLGAKGVDAANRCVALLAALAFFPSTSFVVLYRASWAWLHIHSGAHLPSFVNLTIAAGASSLLVVGHRAGQLLGSRTGRSGLVASIAPAAFAFALVVGLYHRVRILEPARRSADASELVGSRFFVGLLAIDLLLAIAVWLTVREIDDLDDARDDGGLRSSVPPLRTRRTHHG